HIARNGTKTALEFQPVPTASFGQASLNSSRSLVECRASLASLSFCCRIGDSCEYFVELGSQPLERISAFVEIWREHEARLLVRQRCRSIPIFRHVEPNRRLDPGRGAHVQHPSGEIVTKYADDPVARNGDACRLCSLGRAGRGYKAHLLG